MELFPNLNSFYTNLLIYLNNVKEQDTNKNPKYFDYNNLSDGNVLDFEKDNKFLNNEFILPSSSNLLILLIFFIKNINMNLILLIIKIYFII